ncbi:helix-turn-helix transcriptional regulator [Brucellaceae bacterium D45D]
MAAVKQQSSELGPVQNVPRIGLNRVEVALALGVSPNTVDLMVSEGVLPPPKKWHTRKVWLISEIVAAMAEWPTENKNSLGRDAADGDEWLAS